MYENIRAGIVGFGGMGKRHLKAYEKIGCPVVAICDHASSFGPYWYADSACIPFHHNANHMIDTERLDILSVVSNGPTHAAIAQYAVEHGVKRVLVEKPVATSIPDAEALREAVARHGARVAVNHIRRWSPNYLKLTECIREGLIGKPRHAYFHCGSTGLGNFGTHFFDLMRMLSGSEADWAMAAIDPTGTPNTRGAQFKDPAGFGTVVFQNGFRGFLDCSEDTGVQYLVVVAGEYGRVVIDELNAVWTVRARPLGKAREFPFTQYPERMEEAPFSALTHDIPDLTSRAIAELLGNGPVSCTVEDGIRSLEMVMAFHESSETGARVGFPLAGVARRREVLIG